MDSVRHARIKELFFEALERPERERARFLAAACGDDAGLRGEVDSLLTQYHRLDGFLDERADLSMAGALRADGDRGLREHPGEVGRYRIERVLGWGSMGVVYLARQRDPERLVALKVLRRDCVEPGARARFRREAAVLGRLQHDGIAQVFEAGVADTDVGSQPFLAMEYVDGVSLWEHCETEGLGPRERVELVRRIARAIQHAHEQGILHRDLKPDNVLVTATGRPKVLDFGVARLIERDHEQSFRTQTGQILGTVAYMSPEQARGAELGPRADVFSLAVVLYELLTGELPFASRGELLEDLVVRRGLDGEAAPLSAGRTHLRGDLEVVVHAALEPDPARRYPSMQAFADDLGHWLAGRPIEARAPTQVYRLRKLVLRHRLLAVGVGVALLVLSLALGFSLLTLEEVRAAERRTRLGRDALLMLADHDRILELEERAQALWPPGPDQVEPLRAWLGSAAELEARQGLHESSLREVRDGAWELALAEADVGPSFVLGGVDEVLRQKELLVARLDAFFGPGGCVEDVRWRLGLSEELGAHTLHERADLWARAVAAIADPALHPAYGGLRIEPQVGLLPLGPDPASGLWEFAHYGQTGRVPERGADGRLELVDDFAVVLVLLPGGDYLYGVQRDDPSAPRYDPHTQDHEGPPRVVRLDPFFLSKYEVTQHQWVAVEGANPSYWKIGESAKGQDVHPTNPVEHVDRHEALAFARKLACTLPSEVQWAYAARAGGDTVYVAGDRPADRWQANHGGMEEGARDVYRVHSPVGTFPANGFGFHDLDGNLAEWCLDIYKVDHLRAPLPLEAGTGVVVAEWDGDCSLAGGSFASQASRARIGLRYDALATHRAGSVGLRLARPLAGAWYRPAAASENPRISAQGGVDSR